MVWGNASRKGTVSEFKIMVVCTMCAEGTAIKKDLFKLKIPIELGKQAALQPPGRVDEEGQAGNKLPFDDQAVLQPSAFCEEGPEPFRDPGPR